MDTDDYDIDIIIRGHDGFPLPLQQLDPSKFLKTLELLFASDGNNCTKDPPVNLVSIGGVSSIQRRSVFIKELKIWNG